MKRIRGEILKLIVLLTPEQQHKLITELMEWNDRRKLEYLP